jgi:hypothetical protein
MASTAARSRARSSRREPAATYPLMQIELAEHHARTKLCTKLSILAFFWPVGVIIPTDSVFVAAADNILR